MRPDNSTKIKIRKCAIELFQARGFDGVTINDICEQSGISKHTFYYYFESKEKILKTMMILPEVLSQEEMSTILLLDSAYEQYCEIIKKRIHHFEACGKDIVKKILVAKLATSYDSDDSLEMKRDKPFIEMQLGFIKKAQERGEIGNMSEPMILIHGAFCSLIGITQVWATIPGNKFDLEKEYFKILDAMMQKK